MARTKFNTIRIEYAGADLVSGGMLADVSGALNGSTRYTTQAVPHLGADAVELDESGNLERECSVSVAVDYGSEGEMLADVMARQGFADGHQRGVLRYVVEGGGSNARAVVTPLGYYMANTYLIGVRRGEDTVCAFSYEGPGDVSDFVRALNDLANWGAGPELPLETPLIHAELGDDGKVELEVVDPAWAGEAGNALRLANDGDYPAYEDDDPVAFSGGADTTAYAFSAGLTGFEYSSTLGGGGLRVVFTYAFTAGGDADAGA